MGANNYMKKPFVFTIAFACDLCIWEESMSEQGALAETFRSNGPSENFVSVRSEKFNEIQRTCTKKSTAECADFPYKSLLVVVLGLSPLEIGALFPAINSADFSGRVLKVKVVL